MSICAMNWAWDLQDLSSSEKLVLLSLADRAGETHEAWPSWARLIKDTCLDRKTVYKVLASLQDKNLIIKTGEKIKQVFVYKLIGVKGREELSTTSTKNGTSAKKKTSTKNGTPTSTKNGTPTSTKNGTQNHQLNPKRNPKGADALIPSFFNIKSETQKRLIEKKIQHTEDIVLQIEYYAMKFSDSREPSESIDIAIALHAKKQWKIPNGYNGITSRSIAEKEARAERDKKDEYQTDVIAMKNIRSKVMGDTMLTLKSILQQAV